MLDPSNCRRQILPIALMLAAPPFVFPTSSSGKAPTAYCCRNEERPYVFHQGIGLPDCYLSYWSTFSKHLPLQAFDKNGVARGALRRWSGTRTFCLLKERGQILQILLRLTASFYLSVRPTDRDGNIPFLHSGSKCACCREASQRFPRHRSSLFRDLLSMPRLAACQGM